MLRRSLHASFIALVLLASFLGASGTGLSAAPLNAAGVVVRHDDGHLTFAYVTFPEEEISGIELLKRSGLDVVTVSFGGLGEGVCSIDEHGCPSTDCRKRVCQGPKPDDPFWQYFRQGSNGDWQALALGASATKVKDGDVDGWSWTGTTPGLPPLTLAEVAQRAGYSGSEVAASASPTAGAVFRREGTVKDEESARFTTSLAAFAIILTLGLIVLLVTVKRRQPPPK